MSTPMSATLGTTPGRGSRKTYSAGLLACHLNLHDPARGVAAARRFGRWVEAVNGYAQLIGCPVETLSGEGFGYVDDIILDESGEPIFAMLSLPTEGADSGEELSIIPWRALAVDSAGGDETLLIIRTVDSKVPHEDESMLQKTA